MMLKQLYLTFFVLQIGKVVSVQNVFVENCGKDISDLQLRWTLIGQLPSSVVYYVYHCGDVAAVLDIVKQSNSTSTVAIVTYSMATMLQSIVKIKPVNLVMHWKVDNYCSASTNRLNDTETIGQLFLMRSNETSASLLSLSSNCFGTNADVSWQEQLLSTLKNIDWQDDRHQLTVYVYTSQNTELIDYKLRFGEEQPVRLHAMEDDGYSTSRELSKSFYRVGVVKAPPYMNFDLDDDGNVVNASGLVLDILQILASTLDFKYVLVKVSGYGYLQDDGHWSGGGMKSLINHEIDLLAADLSNNPTRAPAIDFTVPFIQGCQRVVIRRSIQAATTKELLRTHLKPFQWPIWLTISFVLMFGTGFLYYIEYSDRTLESKKKRGSNKRSKNRTKAKEKKRNVKEVSEPKKNVRKETWWSIFFQLFGLFCQQGCDIIPNHVSGRIIMYTVCLTALVVYNFYTSVFISFTTVTKNAIPVNSLEDVLRDKSYTVGFVRNNKVEDIFKMSTSPVFHRAWSRMQQSGVDIYVANTSDGIARALNEKFAFITENLHLEWYASGNCSFKILVDKIYQEEYHFGLPLHSPDTYVFSKYMKRIVESGMVRRLKLSHMPIGSSKHCDADSSLEPVGLDRMSGLFICLTAGFVFAMFSLWLEKMVQKTTTKSVNRVLIKMDRK
ncbi:Glutamate receptor ionotropic, kainate 1 [Chamberlinius hualienensis]